MTYQDAVQQAAGCLRRSDDDTWELARLTAENTKNQEGHGAEAGRVSMVQWSADVRQASGRPFSAATGKIYKDIWGAYSQVPVSSRPSWSDAYKTCCTDGVLKARKERIIRDATPEEIAAFQPDERKAAVFTELAKTQPVKEAVTEHGETRAVVAKLQAHAYDADAQRAPSGDAIMQQLTERGALLDLDAANRDYALRVAEIMPKLGTMPSAERDPMANLFFLRRGLEEVHEAVRSVDAFVLHGDAEAQGLLTLIHGGRDG